MNHHLRLYEGGPRPADLREVIVDAKGQAQPLFDPSASRTQRTRPGMSPVTCPEVRGKTEDYPKTKMMGKHRKSRLKIASSL